ncbi:MAG: hypothetical protein ABIG31_01620 [Candidatus Omnitrophota bacterium]
MKKTRKTNNKGIAIIITLLMLVFLVVFAEVSWNYYINNSLLQRRFASDMQTSYDLEAAKTACLWEELHALPPMSWNTVSNTVCRLKGAGISSSDHFYRLPGFNFRAYVTYSGTINMYMHAFKGAEDNPQNSQYSEFIYHPNSPLYQYVMFKNSNTNFPLSGYDSLIPCNGGKIHINGDVTFKGNYVRLGQIMQLSTSGTIKYAQSNLYPAPHYIDSLDGAVDGMAPAPSLESNHYYTTDNTSVTPGPFKYWARQNVCVSGVCTPYYYPAWKSYGSWVGGGWGNNVPAIARGEENFFYGNQYYETSYPTSGNYYLKKDGNYQSRQPPVDQQANVVRFYLSDLAGGSLSITERLGARDYLYGNVYFQPYQDSWGNLNENTWYELPGALPQTYPWQKYANAYSTETPVTFYTTQECAGSSAGCQYAPKPDDPSYTSTGWRYLKQLDGATCTNDTCYNNPGAQYVKAQDYIYNGAPYYDHIVPKDYDHNPEFFSNYTYGEDANDPENPYRQIRAFDATRQLEGFAQYASLLARDYMSGVILPNTQRKEVFLGSEVSEDYSKSLFDDGSKDSMYKVSAQAQGIYIDEDNVDAVIQNLNASKQEIAKKVTFYNWQTSQPITVIDIDIGEMNKQGNAPSNGILYTKFPIRFSNAETLPGQNSSGGKAVFTVISEESVYLKGDYNYDSKASPEENDANWKISNIATQKVVYTLSDNFDDSRLADFAVYTDYPYVYVKADTSSGKVVFLMKEGNPALGNGKWLRGNESYLPSDVQTWITQTVDEKQSQHAKKIKPVNRVADLTDKDTDNDKTEYHYTSLFITSYPLNDSLENWYYINASDQEKQANKYITGTILDLYAIDDDHPEYADYMAALDAAEATWNYRGRLAPSSSYIQSNGARLGGSSPDRYLVYDSKLSSAVPLQSNYAATLGVTGNSIWRFITQSYFNSQTQGS